MRLFPVVLVCLMVGQISEGMMQLAPNACSSSGFKGCECNILGACDQSENPMPGVDDHLTGYAPSGLEQFRYNKYPGSTPNLAFLCEDNTVAIMYDCNAKIPLYAATMITGKRLAVPGNVRPTGGFRKSGDNKLGLQFQQNNGDYTDSKSRKICYESSPNSKYVVDADWYKAAQPGITVGQGQNCVSPYDINKAVHKGHLIAARYGIGEPKRAKATFTYTNVVPQFAAFNSGQWRSSEDKLVIKWGKDKCAIKNGNPTNNVRIYIVVGAIPSTYDKLNQRFFGASGFSDYDGKSTRIDTYGPKTGKKEYHVNVPRYMWTAVCCTFQFNNGQNGLEKMTFYRENDPGKEKTDMGIFTAKFPNAQAVDIFPASLGC